MESCSGLFDEKATRKYPLIPWTLATDTVSPYPICKVNGSISLCRRFSLLRHSAIRCRRALAGSQKRHCALKGPMWILGYRIVDSRN